MSERNLTNEIFFNILNADLEKQKNNSTQDELSEILQQQKKFANFINVSSNNCIEEPDPEQLEINNRTYAEEYEKKIKKSKEEYQQAILIKRRNYENSKR